MKKREQAPLTEKARQSKTNDKIKATKTKKANDAFELKEAPFVTETTASGFSFFPVNGVRIVNGVRKNEVAKIDDETLAPFLRMTQAQREKQNVAFVAVKDKAGHVRLASDLSRFESAFTVALLAEFVEQSRTFYDRVNEIKKIRKANAEIERENELLAKKNEAARKWNATHDDKKEVVALRETADVPRAYVGQDGDDLDDEVKKYMLAKWNVRAFETYTDAKTLKHFDELEKDGEIRGFKSANGDVLKVKSFEVVRGVKTWHCEQLDDRKAVDVILWKSDKFVFLNLSKFWRKYFKQELRGKDYERAVSLVLSLGTKRVPVFNEDGNFSDAQFFTAYSDAFRFGRDYYTLLKLDAVDVFAGTETADDFVKLTENVENILTDASDVEIRLWLAAVDWKADVYKQRKRLHGVRQMNKTCQELFEEFASVPEVEQRRFARFWPKFRTAVLKLQSENVFVFFEVDVQKMTDTTPATPNSRVSFGVNLNMNERQAPELDA